MVIDLTEVDSDPSPETAIHQTSPVSKLPYRASAQGPSPSPKLLGPFIPTLRASAPAPTPALGAAGNGQGHGDGQPALARANHFQVVPLKRKSATDSDTSVSGNESQDRKIHRFSPRTTSRLTTPVNTSNPNPGKPQASVVSVVIPSPSRHLKRELEDADRQFQRQKALRESRLAGNAFNGMSEIFFPVDEDEKRAQRAAYPTVRHVERPPIRIGPSHPILLKKVVVQNKNVRQDPLLQTLRRKLASIRGPEVSIAPEILPMLSALGFAGNFEFINSYILRKGVKAVDEEFHSGCSCNGICDPQRCGCLSIENDSDDRIIPYQRSENNPNVFVLTADFRQRTSMIFECGALCGCGTDCWNRVVQRGRTVRLEIFHTGTRGFGLRSPDRILAGQFIDLYLGEVIPKRIADLREDAVSGQNTPSYLFSLDFLRDDDSIYVVDGQKFGSPTRFMNHSCNPNCKMFTVTQNGGDDRLYDLAFFAMRDIPPMQELTFDYNPGWTGSAKKIDPNAVKCLCGEKNCRGQLWPNQRKGTK